MSKKKTDNNTMPLDNLRKRRTTIKHKENGKIKKGYSQQEIAEKLDIGQDTYSDYELGKTPIPSNILMQLSSILRVSCDYILGRTDSLNIGNKEIEKITGLNETAIEMLRTLKGGLIEDLTANYLYPDLYGVPYNPIGLLNILFGDPNIKGLLSAIEDYFNPVYDKPMYVITEGEQVGGTTALKMDYHIPPNHNQIHKRIKRDSKGKPILDSNFMPAYDNILPLVKDENTPTDYRALHINDSFLESVAMLQIQKYIDTIKADHLAEKSVQ